MRKKSSSLFSIKLVTSFESFREIRRRWHLTFCLNQKDDNVSMSAMLLLYVSIHSSRSYFFNHIFHSYHIFYFFNNRANRKIIESTVDEIDDVDSDELEFKLTNESDFVVKDFRMITANRWLDVEVLNWLIAKDFLMTILLISKDFFISRRLVDLFLVDLSISSSRSDRKIADFMTNS